MNVYNWFYESQQDAWTHRRQQGWHGADLLSALLFMAVIINNVALWGMLYTSAVMEYLCIINQRLRQRKELISHDELFSLKVFGLSASRPIKMFAV